ncbi:hypothetical protein [Flavobacterium hydrophilum]|uniref:Beta-lactamase-inhibitor-like PepSY-like domain-containing protein n=1 Tax=Flavobacterium hydrophilum TaxID=2211445 RepID=A0A2V4CFE4_9FLAO|nr:hypothetical protein [Flavobacterium hydrophilum]PXY44744.1 hypothetical protein DMB68_14925 [Flavobacterium hydrophilum]
MKKLILSAAIVLGSLSVNAFTLSSTNTVQSIIQDGYKEVDAVPAAIKTSLDNAYPGVKLDKAFVNDKKEYRIEITVRGEKSTVYTDEKGNIIKK